MSRSPLHDTEVTLRSRRLTPATLAGVITLLVALFAATPAMAGTVTNVGAAVTFSDDSDTANAVTFSNAANRLRVHDAAAPLTSAGCQQVDAHTVDCAATALVQEVDADLGPGNDSATDNVAGTSAVFNGGAGNDVLTGNDGDDTLNGDDADDVLSGRA